MCMLLVLLAVASATLFGLAAAEAAGSAAGRKNMLFFIADVS